jgi:hypothetical protein
MTTSPLLAACEIESFTESGARKRRLLKVQDDWQMLLFCALLHPVGQSVTHQLDAVCLPATHHFLGPHVLWCGMHVVGLTRAAARTSRMHPLFIFVIACFVFSFLSSWCHHCWPQPLLPVLLLARGKRGDWAWISFV